MKYRCVLLVRSHLLPSPFCPLLMFWVPGHISSSIITRSMGPKYFTCKHYLTKNFQPSYQQPLTKRMKKSPRQLKALIKSLFESKTNDFFICRHHLFCQSWDTSSSRSTLLAVWQQCLNIWNADTVEEDWVWHSLFCRSLFTSSPRYP